MIIESKGDFLEADMGQSIYPETIKEWTDYNEITNQLILWDSPYAGYYGNEDTFTSRIICDSTFIAPTSFNSPEFTKSFICSLYDNKNIGDVFKDARNFYYNSKINNDNLVGLVLQSYTLYGNPMQKINMPKYGSKEIKEWCKNNLKNLDNGIEFIETIGNYSKFRKHVYFDIPEINIVSQGEFDFINATPAFNNIILVKWFYLMLLEQQNSLKIHFLQILR